MSDYRITLRGTGLFRAGDHTVSVTACIPSTGHRHAVLDLMQLLIQTGAFVVTDAQTGEELIVDLSDTGPIEVRR